MWWVCDPMDGVAAPITAGWSRGITSADNTFIWLTVLLVLDVNWIIAALTLEPMVPGTVDVLRSRFRPVFPDCDSILIIEVMP